MKNVGMKPESYRVAEAQAILYAPPHCIQLLRDGNTEKGDALKTARIALCPTIRNFCMRLQTA